MFRRSRLLVLLVLSLAAPAAAGTGSEDSAPTSAVGGLSKDALREVIHANRSQVRSCYEGLIDRFPTLEGKVVIRCIISADGSVSEPSVDSSTVNNAELEACVVDRVQRWAFPKPGGGIRVMFRYPYVFRQSPDPRARAAAPSRRDPSALSAGLGFGYAAPLGSLAQANSGRTVPLSGELSGQLPIVLEAGYRFARHFTAGVYMHVGYPLLVTTGQGIAATGCHLAGVASCHGNAVLRVGVQLAFSFTPDATLQPWVGVGAGYEKAIYVLEDGHGGSLAIGYAGWEPLNLQLGLDIQALPVVAWGPYVAGSLGQCSTIDFDNSLSGVAPVTLGTPRLHGWLQLGLRVRFGS